MRLLIVIPHQPQNTGNAVTAERFSIELRKLGWQVDIIETNDDTPTTIEQALSHQDYVVVLLLHAYRTGRPWLMTNHSGKPQVALLMTGTDQNRDLVHPERGAIIRRVQQAAKTVIVQNRLLHQQLQNDGGLDTNKLRLLPPGISLGSQSYPLRESLNVPDNKPLLLHPASLRPVKQNLELLQMTNSLARNHDFCLAFCGPQLDPAYAAQFFAALEQRPWARYLGEIPSAAMPDAMRQADVILNNSSSEGLPNALVEACTLGRPILARAIDGNRALVEEGANGLLFANTEEFDQQASRLIEDADLRQALSRPNPNSFSPAVEAKRLDEILGTMVRE